MLPRQKNWLKSGSRYMVLSNGVCKPPFAKSNCAHRLTSVETSMATTASRPSSTARSCCKLYAVTTCSILRDTTGLHEAL